MLMSTETKYVGSMLPPVIRQFVGGETAAGALEYARRLNTDGVGAIINRLGEHHTGRRQPAADAREYQRLAEAIAGTDLRARLSVKPTQLGLTEGEACFRENLTTVVESAAARGVFVWIDMEAHTTVEATLAAYETLAAEHGDTIGICLQANLERTKRDLERIRRVGGHVRLVKGGYTPPDGVPVAEIDAAMRERLRTAFADLNRVAVGSHDPEMVALATDLGQTYETDYELQMLAGIRAETQRELAAEHDLWQYIPYGTEWASYFCRRLAERKQNAVVAARALSPV